MDVEKGNSGNTEGPETSQVEDVIDNTGSKRKSSGSSSDVTNLSKSKTFVKESTDEAYTNIASILKTKPFVEYFKDKVNAYKRQATHCFKNQQETEEANSDPEDEISVAGMESAIKCLHPTQNPFHSSKNVITGCLSVLKVKSGNKEKLIAELKKIDNKKTGYISKNSFREYVDKNKDLNRSLPWYYCCDGNPENKAASGTMIDYFFAIAEAKKVRLFPSLVLFLLLALAHILIHFLASQAEKDQLQFDV